MDASGSRVRVIIRQLQLDNWDIATVGRGYGLSNEAINAAILYYRYHQSLFDASILLTNTPDVDWESA